jgi:hypothetical protein
MLDNPFNFNSAAEIHELYGLEVTKTDVDIKALLVKQSYQEHSGLILSDKNRTSLKENGFASFAL